MVARCILAAPKYVQIAQWSNHLLVRLTFHKTIYKFKFTSPVRSSLASASSTDSTLLDRAANLGLLQWGFWSECKRDSYGRTSMA